MDKSVKFNHVNVSMNLTYQKSLKSANFSENYSKNKRWTFWDTVYAHTAALPSSESMSEIESGELRDAASLTGEDESMEAP